MKKDVKIAILDTYVNIDQPSLNYKVNIIGDNGDNIKINHATSICDEIIRQCANVKIDVYPIFENASEID